jgi:hypothetical protein
LNRAVAHQVDRLAQISHKLPKSFFLTPPCEQLAIFWRLKVRAYGHSWYDAYNATFTIKRVMDKPTSALGAWATDESAKYVGLVQADYNARDVGAALFGKIVNHRHRQMSMASAFQVCSMGSVHNEGKWLLPSGPGVQRKIKRRVKRLVIWIATGCFAFQPLRSSSRRNAKTDVESAYD